MGFNDWIYVEPDEVSAVDRFEETDELAKDKLAKRLEPMIRTRVDPGVDLASAQRAQAIRVRAEGGQIVIDEEDRDAMLGGSPAQEQSGLMDLFKMSSGVPSMEQGPGGSIRPVFRSISEESALSTRQDDQDRAVETTVTDTLRMGIVDAFEEAGDEVRRMDQGK